MRRGLTICVRGIIREVIVGCLSSIDNIDTNFCKVFGKHKFKMYVPCPCSCENICDCVGPIVWARVGYGYRIENLQEKDFQFAVDFIKEYFLPNDVLMKIAKFADDPESVNEFSMHLLNIMNNQSSLVLIDEVHDNAIVGFLLLSIVNKLDLGREFSYSNMNRGEAYEKCIELKNTMHKKLDFFLDYKTNCLLRFYLICICNEHRGKQLGFHLIRAGFEIGKHLSISIACGIFTGQRGIVLAERVGFKVVDSINYNEWLDAGRNLIFQPTPGGQKCVALMISKIPNCYISPIVYAEKAGKKPSKKDKKKDGKRKKK